MVTAVILVALGLLGPALAVATTPAARRRTVTPGYVSAGALLVVAGVVFALVADGATLSTADVPVLDWMVARRGPGVTALAEGLALFGGTTFTGGLAVVTAVVLAWRGLRVWALCWVAAVAVGSVAIRVLKRSVERPRPPEPTRLAVETTTSLPSGHSLMAALGLGLTCSAILLLTRGRLRPWRGPAALLGIVLALAIGVSRAYLGVHWTTDVVAGWLIGASIVLVATTLARDLQPVAAGATVSTDLPRCGGTPAAVPTDRPVDPATTTGRPVVPPPPPAGGPEGDDGRGST